MRWPEGKEFPYRGVYLKVVKNRKLAFTDAFRSAWAPSSKAFFTAIIRFEPEGDDTRYTARARHWSAEDHETHEKVGFHEAWGQCAEQLAEVAAGI